MRWKLILPFIMRSQILISTHHVSSVPHLHRSGFRTRATCNCCGHTVGCNLNTKLALVNTSSITWSRPNLPLHFTHICTRGYAKGKARGGDKSDKGITSTWLNLELVHPVVLVYQRRDSTTFVRNYNLSCLYCARVTLHVSAIYDTPEDGLYMAETCSVTRAQ
jgi:hypothetical protein